MMNSYCAFCIFWDEVALGNGICWVHDQARAADTEACENYMAEEDEV